MIRAIADGGERLDYNRAATRPLARSFAVSWHTSYMDLPDKTDHRRPMHPSTEASRGYKRIDRYVGSGSLYMLLAPVAVAITVGAIWGLSALCALVAGIFLTGIAGGFFILPFAIIGAFGYRLTERAAERKALPNRPVLRETEEPTVVEFGPDRKFVIAISSFIPADAGKDRWLEDIPKDLGVPVMAVQTTGGPNPHDEVIGKNGLIRLLIFDAGAPRARILDYLAEQCIETVPLPPSLFHSSAPHKWAFDHYFDTRMDLNWSVQSLLVELQPVRNHTAIICLSGDADVLLVSFDLWLYRNSGIYPDVPDLKNRPRLKLKHRGNLKFAAAIVSTPLRAFTEFKRIEPRKLIIR